VQVVGYDTGTPPADGGRPAALLLADPLAERSDAEPREVTRVDLAPGTDLDYRLGERGCAGTLTDAGHVACGGDRAPYCDAHDRTWVCARCTGTCLKEEMDCYQEHAVYLAAFAPAVFKVGVTRRERLATRLYEQGADRWAHLHTVSNGRIARELEAEVATDVGDRVPVARKVEGLDRAVEQPAWRALLAEFDPHDEGGIDHGLALERRPVAETVAAGRVRGTKGRLLVVDHDGTTYATDLRDLVGYRLGEGGPRDRQSSLAAF
jgi:hypothetical protein